MKSRPWFVAFLLMAVVVIAGLTAGILIEPQIRWRATVVLDKTVGRLPDVAWNDLLWMLRPGSPIYLEELGETENPYEVIKNPYRSDTDLADGERLFGQLCISCHGDRGVGGGGGPSLYTRVFRNGRSDWALYRTVMYGIPGTAMAGRDISRVNAWKLVGYLDDILTKPNASPAPGVAENRQVPAPIGADDLIDAARHPNDWLTYSGSYSGQRHSSLNQIDRGNVDRLTTAWVRQFETVEEKVETSPIVRGSTMFVTEPPNRVLALDATTGRELWGFSRQLPPHLNLCCGTVNRGVAALGNLVFVGTLDAHLIALDAATGKAVWDITVADYSKGYSITGTPLAVGDMVIMGVAGGEFATRGFIDAYEAPTGKRRWRFYTVPAAGEPGSESWPRDSLRVGGPTWLTGSYDPTLRLVYWGIGNPSPNYYGENRTGDNLYTDSVVALDIDTGALRWYFQFTPHDLHDWDAVQIPILVDATLNGEQRNLIAWANRNAFYYLLDRKTGKFLLGVPFVKQTWSDGLDPSGRPKFRPESIPTRQGIVLYPSDVGGTNWWSPAYDPDLQLVFVPAMERPGLYYASGDRPPADDGEILGSVGQGIPGLGFVTSVKALELTTGRARWETKHPPRLGFPGTGGLVSTAGGLVFGGDDETVFALDAETGRELWHFAAGGQILAAPVTYEVDGRQFVAIAAGRSMMVFALPLPAPEAKATANPSPVSRP